MGMKICGGFLAWRCYLSARLNVSSMKILFVSLGVLISNFVHAQGWYKQESGVTHMLGSVQFTSIDTGYVAGSNFFYRTTDAGKTWLPFGPPGAGRGWGYMFFLSSQIGWIDGGTVLYYTENGGQTWENREMPSGRRVKFANKDTGWCVGGEFQNNSWGRTYDGGKTWLNGGLGIDGGILDLVVFDSKHMLAVGEQYDGCAVMAYDSAGASRRIPKVCIDAYMGEIDNLDDSTVMTFARDAFTKKPTIYTSRNRGFAWESHEYPHSNGTKLAEGIDFSDSHNGTLVGIEGAIARTRDAGVTWEVQTSPVLSRLYDVHFIDSLNGTAVGDGGTIIHTSDAGKSWVQQHLPSLLNSNISPQPFATRTTITYELPKAVQVTVRIYDGLGKELQTITGPGVQDAGLHSVEFDGSAFSNEVFYYRIEAYPYVGTGKFSKVPF